MLLLFLETTSGVTLLLLGGSEFHSSESSFGSGRAGREGRAARGLGGSLEGVEPLNEFCQLTGRAPTSKEGVGEGPLTLWFLGRVEARLAGTGAEPPREKKGVRRALG